MRTSVTAFAFALALGALSVNAQTSAPSASPAATSSSVNLSSIPASVLNDTRTASSNFTLPAPDATATLGPNFVLQSSNPFVYTEVDPANLPKMKYNLLNETTEQRQIICNQQTKFCQTAGCAEAGATINKNFCDVATMGVACTCTKGASNLDQWKWPVQFQDCLRRGTTCNNACQIPGGTTAQRNDCKAACQKSFAETCGFPNQYAANYAVSKEGQKPSFSMIQGGNASGAASVKIASGMLAALAGLTAVALLS